MDVMDRKLNHFERMNRIWNLGFGFIPGFKTAYRKSFFSVCEQLIDPVEVRVGGFSVLVDPQDPVVSRRLILRRRWESRLSRLMATTLLRGDTFVDVGANIGYHALHAAHLVGDSGRVVAVEPDPEHVRMIHRSVELNQFPQLSIHQYALTDTPGSAVLHHNLQNRGNQSLSVDNVSHHTEITDVENTETTDVETRRLDDLLQEVLEGRPVDLLKIDVEGAEALVLEGAIETLSAPGIKILLEFWPAGIKAFGGFPERLLTELTGQGFFLHRFGRQGVGAVENPSEIFDRMARSNLEQCDLFVTRDAIQ
jgi:FkbM family methyltransferase